MLNSAGNNSFSDLVSVYLKVFDHLTWIFSLYFGDVQEVLNSDFLNFTILEILNFYQFNFWSGSSSTSILCA